MGKKRYKQPELAITIMEVGECLMEGSQMPVDIFTDETATPIDDKSFVW